MSQKPNIKEKNFRRLIKSANDRSSAIDEEKQYLFKGSAYKIKPARPWEAEMAVDGNHHTNGFDPQAYQITPLSIVLRDSFKVLLKSKWLIIACILAIIIPAILYIWQVTPIYETEATIIYEEANDTAFLLNLGQPLYSKSAILNMVEQIKSRTLADEVIKSLPEGIVNTFVFPVRPPADFSKEKFMAAVIIKNLQVQNIRGSDIIKISIQTNNPLAAKTIANTYVDLIVDWNLQKKKKEISNVRSFVEGQLSLFQSRLKEAEEELLKYKENNELITLSDASKETLTNLTDVEVTYNQTRTEREALEQRRRFLEQKRQELMPALAATSNEVSQKIKGNLSELEQQYATLQKEAKPEDQERMASLREQITHTKRDLINELMKSTARENIADPLSQVRNLLQESIALEVDLETFKAREQGLKNTMDGYNRELQMLPKQELALARLIRDKEVNDKIYGILLERREEARITEAGKVGDVRVIDYADAPIKPIRPNKIKTLIFALVLGLSGGIGLALFLDSLDTSLKTDRDVEKYLNLPVIASIPSISNNGTHHKIAKKEAGDSLYGSKLLPQCGNKSYITEAYRSVQLNFAFLNPDRILKSLLITSSEPSAGKTLTSVNIAQMYAQIGTKTLIMDCDLRRPMIHNVLNIEQMPGLTNLLVDKNARLDSFVHVMGNDIFHGNLAILTSGTTPPNPSEILESRRMEEILAEATDTYELVIIDSPPIISVTDSIILGRRVDGVLLVLRSGKTNCAAAIRTKKILENSHISILGTLLNDVDLKNTYSYYKDYYYYSEKKIA